MRPVSIKKRSKRGKRKVGTNLQTVEWREPRKAGSLTNLSASQHAGVKFERTFLTYMADRYEHFMAGDWLYFVDENGWGYCQPDGILRELGVTYIFECKLSFTYRKAYSEMRNLYQPLLEKLYPEDTFVRVQVCRHLKPSAKRTTVVQSMKEIRECLKTQMTWRWSPSLL